MNNNLHQKKEIYVVLTQTNTLLAAAIRYVAKQKYSHVSLSFDENCMYMYSFGRKYYRNPVFGVFKREKISDYIFSGKDKNRIALYRLRVSEEDYEQIKQNVDRVSAINTGFNVLGLLTAIFGYKLDRNKYYCAEFVYEAMNRKTFLLGDGKKHDSAIRPEDIVALNSDFELIYEGRIKDFIRECKDK